MSIKKAREWIERAQGLIKGKSAVAWRFLNEALVELEGGTMTKHKGMNPYTGEAEPERDRTHYEGCWRSRSHWRCAVARCARLEAELRLCRDKCAALDEAVYALVEERDQYDADLECVSSSDVWYGPQPMTKEEELRKKHTWYYPHPPRVMGRFTTVEEWWPGQTHSIRTARIEIWDDEEGALDVGRITANPEMFEELRQLIESADPHKLEQARSEVLTEYKASLEHVERVRRAYRLGKADGYKEGKCAGAIEKREQEASQAAIRCGESSDG